MKGAALGGQSERAVTWAKPLPNLSVQAQADAFFFQRLRISRRACFASSKPSALRLRLTDITLNAGIQVGTGETGSFMINSPHDTLTTPAGESVTGKGFTVSLGASAPVPVGKVIGAVYYGRIKADTEERQINDNMNAVLAYEPENRLTQPQNPQIWERRSDRSLKNLAFFLDFNSVRMI